MLLDRPARVRPWTNRPQAHQSHQSADPLAASLHPAIREISAYPPGSLEGVRRVDLVYCRHQIDRRAINADSLPIEGRTVHAQQVTLPYQADL